MTRILSAIVIVLLIFTAGIIAYQFKGTSERDSFLTYIYVNRYLRSELLTYVSGNWRSPSGSNSSIDLINPRKIIKVDNNEYTIITLDSIDALSGIIKFMARDSNDQNLRFQINKVLEVSGVIVIIFDPKTATCDLIRKNDPKMQICMRAYYIN